MKTHEMHPLFPSGEWEGFYSYYPGDKHLMQCSFTFCNALITGRGNDDIGSFSWKGVYNTAVLSCSMTKFYSSHTVFYTGEVDENGIWGNWDIDGIWRGGFHLWPKTKQENQHAQKVEIETLLQQPLIQVLK
ncbi:hypothetical protein Q0590_32645 [Rhodocytophaga aerolata]|uniref:Uncharacterized protein n=1 Tax=Rhodocytophaga aerolata TaxID=455078 RepID=A0ABT8RGG3_9BACT|nr:hypothetical protein [Rhodocytophaga aerolata]MDO1451069.1 hypothetical protein [Rhodocytophaga aerolata]